MVATASELEGSERWTASDVREFTACRRVAGFYPASRWASTLWDVGYLQGAEPSCFQLTGQPMSGGIGADRIDNVDTQLHRARMTKRSSNHMDDPNDRDLAVVERTHGNAGKGSINLRIENRTRELIDEAAAALGKTRTEFMVESARKTAIDVLLDQRIFVLGSDRYDAFKEALDNPPPPGAKLRGLFLRTPPWKA